MTVRTVHCAPSVDANKWRWDLAFIGDTIDERGRAAVDFVRNASTAVVTVGSYSPERLDVAIDGSHVAADEFAEVVARFDGASIILEATTLGFVELFFILRAFEHSAGKTCDIVYIEPDEYAPISAQRRSVLSDKRQFELSGEVRGYLGIPGAAVLLTPRTKHHAILFLGYEERRLDVAFETQILLPDNCDVVFGVPAYAPGWEMNAFANNVRVLNERQIRGDVHYCAANDPDRAGDIISQISKSINSDEILILVPIGTKPHGIAVADFAAANQTVRLLYDHPLRKTDRSKGIRRWHVYRVVR